MNSRPTFRVSCKAAIFDPSGESVLVTRYTPTKSGLPGGHVEPGEKPDETVVRELREEIGVAPTDLERKDFFITDKGKVILGYVATLPPDQVFDIDPVEIAALDWVRVEDIKAGLDSAGQYDEFVLQWAK
jgi:8-oxo-dGTP pyrophosphatase MutT (NUDIX family)